MNRRHSIVRTTAVLGSLVLALNGAGCAKDKAPGDSAAVETGGRPDDAAKGTLITDRIVASDKPGDGSVQLQRTADMFRMFPPEVGVKIIEVTDDRLIVEYNHTMLGYYMPGKAGAKPDPIPCVPVRMVMNAQPIGGDRHDMRHRRFYIGGDPTMARTMLDGYKGTPLELKR